MKIPPIEIKTRSLGFTKIRKEDFLDFEHERLEGADFSGRKLKGMTAHGSQFISCSFEKLRVETASFGAGRVISEYIECNFDGLRFRTAFGGYARFERCTFRNVDLCDWFCFATEFVDCTFSGKMKKAIFNGTPLERDLEIVHRSKNEFHGNDFSEVKLEDVAFRTGIDLTKQKLPTAPEYLYLPDAVNVVRRVREDVLTWRDLDLRQQAMNSIRSLEFELKGGQEQLLLGPETPMDPGDQAVQLLLRKYSENR